MKDVIRLYGTQDPTNGRRKGLIFSIEFKQNSTTGSHFLEGSVSIAEGLVDPTTGIPKIPGTQKIMCPHPPPCQKNLDGTFMLDENNGGIISEEASGCYSYE